MKVIFSFLVSAPSWKLFLLFILPMAISTALTWLTESLIIAQFGMLLNSYIVLLWEYSVCSMIYEKYYRYLDVPILWFKISIGYIFIYIIFFSLFSEIIPIHYFDTLHIVSVACHIYCIYFLSKLLVTVEKKGKVKFSEYFGPLISAWILIIGIWNLQPRIKKILISQDV